MQAPSWASDESQETRDKRVTRVFRDGILKERRDSTTGFQSVFNDPSHCFKSYSKKMRLEVRSLFCFRRFPRRHVTRELHAIYGTESLNFTSIPSTRFPSVDNDPHLCFKSCRKKLRLDAETFLGLR